VISRRDTPKATEHLQLQNWAVAELGYTPYFVFLISFFLQLHEISTTLQLTFSPSATALTGALGHQELLTLSRTFQV